jgi:uncharacterized membrane protein YphA (DoxX/SURF4 family)
MRTATTTSTHSRKTTALLWTVQGLLALVFLFAGGMKLITPMAVLAQQAPLPPLFLKLIGLCEVAGALGLVLPGLVRVGRSLTPLAAAGLVIIMIGATVITAAGGHIAGATVPCIVGLLAAFIAYKRRVPGRVAGAELAAA